MLMIFSYQDVNECLTNNGGCQYQCKNTDGSYVCECPEGYHLNNNSRTCDRKSLCFIIML